MILVVDSLLYVKLPDTLLLSGAVRLNYDNSNRKAEM